MGVDESIKSAMLVLIKNQGIHNAIRVDGWEEKELSTGYCETCYDEYTVVMIQYITDTGVRDEFEYYGQFSELIQELTSY